MTVSTSITELATYSLNSAVVYVDKRLVEKATIVVD